VVADAKRLEDNQTERFDFEGKTDKVEREKGRKGEKYREKLRDLTLRE